MEFFKAEIIEADNLVNSSVYPFGKAFISSEEAFYNIYLISIILYIGNLSYKPLFPPIRPAL